MITPATMPSAAGHGLHPPSRSPLRRAKEGRSFPPLSSTASLPPDRRGRLKNGARPGDFLAAPRCGARTRCGGSCRQPAMANGRCRMHGGMSTGPRTTEGRERCRRARLTHGGYSAPVRALRTAARAHGRRVRALLDLMRGRTAGHGLLPSISGKAASASSGLKVNHRDHRGHRVESNSARAARHHPSSVTSVRSVVNPSSAGHGLHPPSRSPLRRAKEGPSFSNAPVSPRARRLLAGVAPLAAFSAGHGVLPSFSLPRAVVPTRTP
jgi:hypothetical protein